MVGERIDAALERLQALKEEVRFTREQLIVVGILAILAIAGGLLAARQSRITPIAVDRPADGKTQTGMRTKKENPPRRAEKKPKPILVHVAGDVVNPGVHEVKPGARVSDAVSAAGGAIDGKILDHVNLAAKIIDGQKIMVSEEAAPELNNEGLGDGAAAALVNINAATATDLERLDGIGPVLAQRILAWRNEHNGFTSIAQLDQVSGIGPKKFAGLKDHVSIN